MNLSQLPKTTTRSAKRVGRGMGSGRGSHTSGRGHKGQKSREKVRIFFEGTKMKKSLVKKLPFQRGKNKFKSWPAKPATVTLADLETLPVGSVVTQESLVKAGLVPATALRVKVLATGELTHVLTVKVPASQAAVAKITAAGGKIEEV